MKNKIIIGAFFSFFISYSQNNKDSDKLNILVVSNESLIETLKTNKDTTSLSVSIYINGYELKENRTKSIEEYSKNKGTSNSIGMPTFSINFVSLTKPEVLETLCNINYISAKEFVEGNLRTTNPTYIIYKQKNGLYLRWSTNQIPIE